MSLTHSETLQASGLIFSSVFSLSFGNVQGLPCLGGEENPCMQLTSAMIL